MTIVHSALQIGMGVACLIGAGIVIGCVIIEDWKAQNFEKKKTPKRDLDSDRASDWYSRRSAGRRDTILSESERILASARESVNPDKPAAPKLPEHKGNG